MLSNPVMVTLGPNCNMRGRMASAYAKKRRFLRDHRVQMRVMEDVLEFNGLTTEYHAEVMVEMDNVPFWLGFDDGPGGVGESSDTEDPETILRRENEQLRREVVAQQAFIATIQDLQDHQAVRTDLERARMMSEDRIQVSCVSAVCPLKTL